MLAYKSQNWILISIANYIKFVCCSVSQVWLSPLHLYLKLLRIFVKSSVLESNFSLMRHQYFKLVFLVKKLETVVYIYYIFKL